MTKEEKLRERIQDVLAAAGEWNEQQPFQQQPFQRAVRVQPTPNMEKYFDPNREYSRKGSKTDLPPRTRRCWNVGKLWDNHKEVARRLALGQKNVQIAAAVGMTPMAISTIKNSPATQEQIEILQGKRDADTMDVIDSIKQLVPKALKVLDDVISGTMESASPTLRANAAKDILDRAGFSAPKNINVQSVHAVLSREDLNAIKQRAREIAASNGVVIDV